MLLLLVVAVVAVVVADTGNRESSWEGKNLMGKYQTQTLATKFETGFAHHGSSTRSPVAYQGIRQGGILAPVIDCSINQRWDPSLNFNWGPLCEPKHSHSNACDTALDS